MISICWLVKERINSDLPIVEDDHKMIIREIQISIQRSSTDNLRCALILPPVQDFSPKIGRVAFFFGCVIKLSQHQYNHKKYKIATSKNVIKVWEAPRRFVGSYQRLGINPGSPICPSDKQLNFFAPRETGGSCQDVVLLQLSAEGENSRHYRPWIITSLFLDNQYNSQ